MARIFGPILFLTLLVCLPPAGRAELITFAFADQSGSLAGLALDGLSNGVVVASGTTFDVTMSAAAGSSVSGDRFNLTGSPNFGINASAAGDVTDAFDAGAGTSEFMELSFTASIPASFELIELDFDRISGTGEPGEDAGLLSFANGMALEFSGQSVDATDLFVVGVGFAATETLRLAHVDGNGFGLERLVLDVRPEPATTVPEASSLSLLGLGTAILYLKRQRLFRRRVTKTPNYRGS